YALDYPTHTHAREPIERYVLECGINGAEHGHQVHTCAVQRPTLSWNGNRRGVRTSLRSAESTLSKPFVDRTARWWAFLQTMWSERSVNADDHGTPAMLEQASEGGSGTREGKPFGRRCQLNRVSQWIDVQ